jgi:cob(I)alamin adenosyltransferase
MSKTMRVYTRTGDDGSTGLGNGERTAKDSLRLETYGSVDELNSCLGLVASALSSAHLVTWIRQVQNDLFQMGGDLCIPEGEGAKRPLTVLNKDHIGCLETWIDECQFKLPALREFILPGGSESSARLHLARTICRRVERLVVALSREESLSASLIPYLNRLSDFLFVLARYENLNHGVEDIPWQKDSPRS